MSSSTSPQRGGRRPRRSATEAFLFRRLETLPETAGRFRLNVELPIPFDGWGQMEVDLLCADARLAVELDGEQHLPAPKRIGATGARIFCCRRMAILFCGFLRKMLESALMKC